MSTASRVFTASWLGRLVALSAYSYFYGYGPTHLRAVVSWWVGYEIRYAYKFGGGVSADSAGCTLGRFSHWWRSVSEPVFGERGFHTSFALASTVLLGHL